MRSSALNLIKSLPGIREAVWSVKYRLGINKFSPYNGRWDRLRGWLADLERIPLPANGPPPRRILVFAVHNGWVNYLLPTCIVMAARGADIDFVWSPRHLFGIDDSLQERYSRWASRFAVPVKHPRLRLHNLSSIEPSPATEEMKAMADRVAQLDSAYIAQRDSFDRLTEELRQRLYPILFSHNLDCITRIHTLCERRTFDGALTANGLCFENGAFFQYCRSRGLDCITMEGGELKFRIVVAKNQPVAHLDTSQEWAADEPHHLSAEAAVRVAQRLAGREKPNWSRDYVWQGQIADPEDEAGIRRNLRLEEGRPLAVMCTNLAWDSAVIERGVAFRNHPEWIIATVRWFAERRPDWYLIVRTHPGEAIFPYESSGETAQQLIADRFSPLPSNVRVVCPTDPINTYSLLPLCQFGIVYVSTIGLEMASRGYPVVLAGRVHYANKGFTLEPASPSAYFGELARLTAAVPTPRLTSRQIELARCYTDVFFERWPKPFPWSRDHPERDFDVWPVSRILAGDCPPEFLKTFDLLAGLDHDTTCVRSLN